uniref:hypothetical protein n=1 Tax=Fusobacterium sp. TaxID=68766 RepID=UPI0025B7E869
MLNKIEKLLKKCNKKRARITLGLVISFLISANLFAEVNEVKKLEDFSEIKKIFKDNYRINKELTDGTKVIIGFIDGKIIIFQKNDVYIETIEIALRNLKKLNNADVIYD